MGDILVLVKNQKKKTKPHKKNKIKKRKEKNR